MSRKGKSIETRWCFLGVKDKRVAVTSWVMKISKVDEGTCCTSWQIYLVHLKQVNFVVCKLYLNRAVLIVKAQLKKNHIFWASSIQRLVKTLKY
jgi:hypothetical protein